MISLWVHQSKNRGTVHCTVKFDLTLFINQILSLWIKMLLTLIYRVEGFFCIYFTRLCLLLNLNEMGHSEISISVTLFKMVMFVLKVSIFSLRVSIKSHSFFIQEKETKGEKETRKIIFHRKWHEVIICTVIYKEIKF